MLHGHRVVQPAEIRRKIRREVENARSIRDMIVLDSNITLLDRPIEDRP